MIYYARDVKDTVYPFFELVPRMCRCVICMFSLAILRTEVCLNSIP